MYKAIDPGPVLGDLFRKLLVRDGFQVTEHLWNFTLILHEGRPRILRSILVLALPDESTRNDVSGVGGS